MISVSSIVPTHRKIFRSKELQQEATGKLYALTSIHDPRSETLGFDDLVHQKKKVESYQSKTRGNIYDG